MKPARKKRYKRWIALVLLILAFIGYLLIDAAMRPTILSITEEQLRAIGVKAMNDAVRETIGADVNYSDLINIEKDSNGRITLVSANAVMMNNLAAQTANTAQEKILSIGKQGIGIPIGTILGGQLMTGRGPNIVIQVEPVGSVTSDFQTEFEDAGINQTRHKIYLVLNASVRILMGSVSQTVEITSQVLISDTIIVGDVPQSFVDVANEDDMLNLLPDNMVN